MNTSNMGCLARWMIAALFIISGANMALNFGSVAGWFGSMGLPMPQVLLVIVIAVKVVGGIVYALGKQYAKEAGYALVAFTVVATVLGHMNPFDMTAVLKNIAIIGGLLATLPCVCNGTCAMCKSCEPKKA